jgi:hypothetical protein
MHIKFPVLFSFFNMTPIKFKIKVVSHNVFVLDSTAREKKI